MLSYKICKISYINGSKTETFNLINFINEYTFKCKENYYFALLNYVVCKNKIIV